MQVSTVSDLGIASNKVQEFYQENWSRPITLGDQRFYNWQFVNTPQQYSSDNCVIAYDDNAGRIAGVMGLNPRQFLLENNVLSGAEMTTWIVHSDYRASGAGAKILKHIMASYDVLIGMGITEQALPIYLRSGFRLLRQIPRFIKVINFQNIKPFCQADELGLRLAPKWSALKINHYLRSDANNDTINTAFEASCLKMNMFDRCATQLNWRYLEHPMFNYELHHVSAGGTDSGVIVALRVHDTDAGFRICHILDLFGDADSIDAGRSFVEEYARQNAVDVIDFYCTSTATTRHFTSNQWFSVVDDTCFQFPHLFSPLEMRSPQSTSLIYWAKHKFTDLADLSKLYLTKQDADLDRPVLEKRPF